MILSKWTIDSVNKTQNATSKLCDKLLYRNVTVGNKPHLKNKTESVSQGCLILTSLTFSDVIGLLWQSIAPSATIIIFSLFFRARFYNKLKAHPYSKKTQKK